MRAAVARPAERCSEGQTQAPGTGRRASHIGKQARGLLKSGRKKSVNNCKARRWLGGLRAPYLRL